VIYKIRQSENWSVFSKFRSIFGDNRIGFNAIDEVIATSHVVSYATGEPLPLCSVASRLPSHIRLLRARAVFYDDRRTPVRLAPCVAGSGSLHLDRSCIVLRHSPR
jgi:hypothetical protein